MSTNTQLPAEFQKELDDLVMKHTLKLRNDNDYQIGYEKGVEKGIKIGATAYATKAYQAQQEIDSLTNQLKKHSLVADENMKVLNQLHEKAQRENKELKEALQQLCDVLPKGEAFRSYHANVELGYARGILVLYNEIKTFLDAK